MTFSGRVENISHMRGLLVSFEGRSPNLGDTIRVKGGKVLGRVDTVLGPVDSGLVHVFPILRGVEVERAIGSPVEIAPRKSGNKRTHGEAKGREKYQRGEVVSPEGKSIELATEGRKKREGTNRNSGPRGEGVRNPTEEGLEGIPEGVAEGEKSRS